MHPPARGHVRSAFAVFAIVAFLWSAATPVYAAAPDERGCYVSFTMTLSTRDGGPRRVREARVLPDCSVVIGDESDSSSHRADGKVAGRDPTCRLINRLHGIPGAFDTLTELTTYNNWAYDGTLVTAQSMSSGHWEQAVTGWYIWSGPTSSQDTTAPAFRVEAYTTAQFRSNTPYDWTHTKNNWVRVYGDGTCNATYQHIGNVCGGCGVVAYLDVY